MYKTFAEMLEKIRSQANVLSKLEERAVELGVVIPVLRQLDWDTDLIAEVFPQQVIRMVANAGGYGQMDYALQVERRCKVLLEVKRWSVELGGAHEVQLNSYCLAASGSGGAAPELAVLTNGRNWNFYRTHWSREGQPPIGEIREFLKLDIINDDLSELEGYFREFLGRNQFLGRRVW